MAIIFPVVVVGAAGLKVLWLGRLIQHEFDINQANEAFRKDIQWDKIRAFGKDALTFAEALLKTPSKIQSYDDFRREIEKLNWCKCQLTGLSDNIRAVLDEDSRASEYLEKRMRQTVTEYAIFLGSIDEGTPTEQLSAIYMSLYLMGRLNRPLSRQTTDQILDKLTQLHRKRRQKIDVTIRNLLLYLSSENAPRIVDTLRQYSFIRALGIDPEYIVFALMGYTFPKLTHTGLFEEMVESVKKSKKSTAA